MEIVDVEIESESSAHVTPLELIEDFADVTSNWHFLEEDSRLYAAIRGREACVIRAWNDQRAGSIDFAFADCSDERSLLLRIVILCPPFARDSAPSTDAGETAPSIDQCTCLQLFLNAFGRYLQERGAPVNVRPISVHFEETAAA